MQLGFRKAGWAALLLVGIVVGSGRPERVRAAEPTYEILNVGPTGGQALAYSVNNAGQVAGSGVRRGFIWSSQGLFMLPPVKRDEACGVSGMNAQGLAAGSSIGAMDRAVKWKNGKAKLLAKPAGSRSSYAYALNDRGQVVGAGYDQHGQPYAVLWTGSHAKKLPALNGATRSGAFGINNRGQVVGHSGSGGAYHAVLWEGKQVTDLGTLPGYSRCLATDLNEVGQIVGTAEDEEEDWKAVLWQHGVLASLPDLGGSYNRARAINENGHIVGNSGGSAVLWRDGQVIDLNTFLPPDSGWELTDAYGINDQGWIVGTGYYGEEEQAFLLRPLP